MIVVVQLAYIVDNIEYIVDNMLDMLLDPFVVVVVVMMVVVEVFLLLLFHHHPPFCKNDLTQLSGKKKGGRMIHYSSPSMT